MSPAAKRLRKASPSAKPNFISSNKNPRSKQQSSHTHYTLNPHPKKRVEHSLASKQRNVFDWYEEHQDKDIVKDIFFPDAGDIFSPEWQRRLNLWGKEFNQDMSIDLYQQNPEDLNLGLLFQAHPIYAFALWHVLQACYELDRLICGTSMREKREVAEWQSWRPFQYLLSTKIISTWEKKLESLSVEFEKSANEFEKEAIVNRLYAMDRGVRVLREVHSTLKIAFTKEIEKSRSYWILDLVQKGLDNRYRAFGEDIPD